MEERLDISEVKTPGMSIVVRTVTRWVKTFIFLFGLYIISHGHLTPGGGFAGGVIVCCAFILLMLAFGRERAFRKLTLGRAGILDSVGVLGFLLVAVLGLFFAGTFFVNWLSIPATGWLNTVLRKMGVGPFRLLSSGTIPISNLWIALKVSSSLFLVFALLSMLRIDSSPTVEE